MNSAKKKWCHIGLGKLLGHSCVKGKSLFHVALLHAKTAKHNVGVFIIRLKVDDLLVNGLCFCILF